MSVIVKVDTMQNVQSILVIEDNEGDFFLLKDVLEHGDLQIEQIINLSNIQLVHQQKESLQPSLIFLDLVLPDSYGLSSLAEIKQLFPSSPIIVLSGMNDLQLALEALQSGAQNRNVGCNKRKRFCRTRGSRPIFYFGYFPKTLRLK